MKTIFEIYKDLTIDTKFDLKSFIQDSFSMLPVIDPVLLDQMTADEICTSDNFYNSDLADPFIFLLQHNKITPDGFKLIMRKNIWFSQSDTNRALFSELMFEYIIEHKIDIADYMKNGRVDNTLLLIIGALPWYKDRFDLLSYIDLKQSIIDSKHAISVILFDSIQLEVCHRSQLEYIKDNIDVIKELYFNGKDEYLANPTYHMGRGYSCLHLVEYIANIASWNYVVGLGIEYLLIKYYDQIDSTKTVEFEEVCQYIIDNREVYPNLYTIMYTSNKYKSLTSQIIDLKNVSRNELLEIIPTLDNIALRKLFKDVNTHLILNSDDNLYYGLEDKLYFMDYTEAITNVYIDEITRHEKSQSIASKEWRFNSLKHHILTVVLHEVRKRDEMMGCFIKCFYSHSFKRDIIEYIQNNGDLELLNYVYNISPKTVASEFNHELLLDKVILTTFNKNLFSW